MLSAEGNVAKIKMYSWRYGSPDDEKEETLTYDPVKKTLTVGKEHLTVFKDAPSITPALLKETYRKQRCEIRNGLGIFLSQRRRTMVDGSILIYRL